MSKLLKNLCTYEEERDSQKLKQANKLQRSRKIVPDDDLGTNEQEYSREFGYR